MYLGVVCWVSASYGMEGEGMADKTAICRACGGVHGRAKYPVGTWLALQLADFGPPALAKVVVDDRCGGGLTVEYRSGDRQALSGDPDDPIWLRVARIRWERRNGRNVWRYAR